MDELTHVIDLDADPAPFNDWEVEEHRPGGLFRWDPKKVKFFLAYGQKGSGHLKGHAVREAVRNRPVMNANALDYLLAHQQLIPESWKGNAVFFWGTIYRSGGNLYVRDLNWYGGRWLSRCYWLDDVWHSGNPAAVGASI